jgi:hypothetical protein
MVNSKLPDNRAFSPLNDLYDLLQMLEERLNIEINDDDYVIGRKQLYFTFMHETLHAFIRKSAPWIFSLSDDEIDFIDETAVRFLIDDFLQDPAIYSKVDEYYHDFVRHKTDLKLYGFNLLPSDYEKMNIEYLKSFSVKKDIDGLCHYLQKKYNELGIEREEGFSYSRTE